MSPSQAYRQAVYRCRPGCWRLLLSAVGAVASKQLFAPLVREGVAGFHNSYVGAMRITEAGFEYWIGVFMAPEAPVPQGYEAVEIPAGDLGVCFLYGKDSSPDLFGMDAHKACVAAWQERGWTPSGWFLERYNCPRYTVPDEKGNVILDYCAYLLPISKE